MSASSQDGDRRVDGLSVKRLFASMAARLAGEGDSAAKPLDAGIIERVGDFELLEEVGRGGMGVVFRARQCRLDREVAVKMLLSGNFAGEDERVRFRDEAAALAILDHPHIAPVYEVGEHEGRPFLAMKYLPGGDLGDAIARGEFEHDPKTAVRVMIKLAGAISEAHAHGLLHRDLKPANILLDVQGQPHITDFGLVRHLGTDSSLTLTGVIVGSPNYMAPEQARGGASSSLTTAADLYSLGALLYHLLTGQPPFLGETPLATLKAAAESEPKSPALLNPKVDRDLATICLHCLEKSPEKRYGSAREFEEDLTRWLEGKPISAREATTSDRLVKWARRHPARASIVALIAFALVAFSALVAKHQADLGESRDAALQANVELTASIEQLEFERADEQILRGLQREGILRLVSILEKNPHHRAAAERLAHEWKRRHFPIHAAPPIVQAGEDIRQAAYSPDGRWFATASESGALALFDGEDGTAGRAPVPAVVPDPRLLVFAADGSRLFSTSGAGEVGAWSVPDLGRVAQWEAAPAVPCAFSPDGLTVITREGSELCFREAESGEVTERLALDGQIEICVGSPTGNLLYCIVSKDGESRRMQWWDWSARTLCGERPITGPVYGTDYQASFSADGQRLVMRTGLHAIHVFDCATMEPVGEPFFHKLRTWRIALDRDGSHLALGLNSGLFEIREVATDRRVIQQVFEVGFLRALSFDPVRPVLAVGTSDGTATLWDIPSTPSNLNEVVEVEDVHASDYFHHFSADGRKRVSFDRQHRAWLTVEGEVRQRIPVVGRVHDVRLSEDGSRIAISRERPQGGAAVELLDTDSLELVDELWQTDRRAGIHFAPGSRCVLLVLHRGGGRMYDYVKREIVFENPDLPGPFPATHSVAFHPDGSWFVLMEWEGKVRRWDARTGQALGPFAEISSPSNLIALNPDGTHALTGGFDTKLRGWRVDPQGHAHPLWVDGYPGAVIQAAFHPDGRSFVAASIEGTVRLGKTRDGTLLGSAMTHELEVTTAQFTPDGRHVLTASKDHTARLWDAASGNPVTSPLAHDEWWSAPEIAVPVDKEWLERVARASARTIDRGY